ncbi:MAG: PEP-CTERM sorting domain-containing protein [Phycisphaerae bacterium]|jgi:hypothetical protein|nr:PEP-CTERM sorting domain-containing protein [Phycisphaerae bacterium]
MRNATQILILITIICCLAAPQYTHADGSFLLTGPNVTFDGTQAILRDAGMTPSSGGNATGVKLAGNSIGAVDSFFDVFTELSLDIGETYQVDSFFDVFTELSVDGGGQWQVDSFFDVFVELNVTPGPRLEQTRTFETEIVSMSLSGNVNGTPVVIGVLPSPGGAKATDLGEDQFHVDSFFDITYTIDFTGSGGTGGPIPGSGPTPMRVYPTGVPSPRQVHGKEYSHHLDIDAPPVPPVAMDPMQNIAWDGTGNAWDTFDYSSATNVDWEQGTNVDAIANIKDRFFHEVVNDQVALLVTIDDGAAVLPVPTDYENIHYQTAGGPGAGIWARGVIPSSPLGSDIHTVAVQTFAGGSPDHLNRWLSPTGIEVWGPEVRPGPVGGGPGTGDDAIMFSTNDEWDSTGNARPAVWKFDPVNNLVFPYIMANQIRDAIDTPLLKLAEDDHRVDLDGMMIYDELQDDEFGPGDSILFTIHTLKDATGAILLDGGEIWVWKFDDGPNGAQFLNHGGFVWDTANSVIGIFPNVQAEENIGGLEAVPEPATMSLLALGGLALLKRKRRKA